MQAEPSHHQKSREGKVQLAVYAPAAVKFELKTVAHFTAVTMDAIVNTLIAGFLRDYRKNPKKATEHLKNLLELEDLEKEAATAAHRRSGARTP